MLLLVLIFLWTCGSCDSALIQNSVSSSSSSLLELWLWLQQLGRCKGRHKVQGSKDCTKQGSDRGERGLHHVNSSGIQCLSVAANSDGL